MPESTKPLENAHLLDIKAIPQPKNNRKRPGPPHIKDLDHYKELYKESIENPSKFFGDIAAKELDWIRPFDKAKVPDTGKGFINNDVASWFVGGQLNASYNSVDRHALKNPDKVAIVYEADEPNEGRNVTYGELLKQVSKVAAILTNLGVQKGDTVAVYLPMIPEAIVSLLAITRIGALHSVVFAGFSSASLRDRINDANSKIVITADESKRGSKTIETKKIVDEALKQTPQVRNVLVVKRTGNHVPFDSKRDLWWHEEVKKYGPYFPPTPVNSEDPLFLLYTSGSTGSPKGIQHSTAGYLLSAMISMKYIFDLHQEDTFFTAGDIGWITGHTYVVYGPLLNGATTVCYEGTPAYPSYSRYWQIIQNHKVTQFYVAPTALRLLKRAGDSYIEGYDLSSLRTLGSVGEPIAAEVWEWYYEKIGKSEIPILDTWWMTESGSALIAGITGVTPLKPGSASLPYFGVEPIILDATTGEELKGPNVEGILAIRSPWPSIARTIWKNYDRYLDTYLKPYPGYFFSGDGAARDADGFFWILGRVDDVVNVSGHRLSTAEIEAALIENPLVAESAVVGFADELTGQAVAAFVALKSKAQADITKELILTVRKEIGPFAAPKLIILVDDLPKTRSGKIMRRILRKILAGEEDQLGDVSTLSNPQVVDSLIQAVREIK